MLVSASSSEPRTVPGIWEALRDYAMPGWVNELELERKKRLAPLVLPQRNPPAGGHHRHCETVRGHDQIWLQVELGTVLTDEEELNGYQS